MLSLLIHDVPLMFSWETLSLPLLLGSLVMPFVLSFSGRQHECGECKCRSSRWLADGQDSQRGQSWFASECSSLPSQNMGRVVSSDEIRHATGTSEWARRLRELRDEFGYAILTCADETRAKSRGISKASLFKHPIIERLLLQIQRVRLMANQGQRDISIVPTFVPTQQTDGHRCAQPATC